MKKLIATIGIFSIMLCSCGISVNTFASCNSDSMFVIVETTPRWRIVYHKNTKVMYAVSAGNYNVGNFTLLVNPDGTPMIWED